MGKNGVLSRKSVFMKTNLSQIVYSDLSTYIQYFFTKVGGHFVNFQYTSTLISTQNDNFWFIVMSKYVRFSNFYKVRHCHWPSFQTCPRLFFIIPSVFEWIIHLSKYLSVSECRLSNIHRFHFLYEFVKIIAHNVWICAICVGIKLCFFIIYLY